MGHCNICGSTSSHAIHCPEHETRKLQSRVAELEYQLNTEIGSYASAKIAELEAENARLNASPTIEACRQMIRDKAVKEASDLHTELAAEQAAHAAAVLSNVQLREAVINSTEYKLGHPGYEALSTPISTEALDKYVAEKVKEATIKIADELQAGRLQWMVRETSAEEQVATITRQRDLAVEALDRAVQMVGHPDNIAYLQHALCTIKES